MTLERSGYKMTRFDERDTIFSRLELIPGSKRYTSYYTRRPEFKEIDDRFRSAPPGVYAHDRVNTARTDSAFRFLKDIRPLACRNNSDQASGGATLMDIDIEKALHETALEYGAVLYGRALLGMECFYSVRGRGPAYGEAVKTPLRSAIVFAVEMNREKISRAPRPEEAVEVTRAYVQVAVIGMVLSYFLEELGYRARCHMDGESELVLPAAAQAAGLGKIGRLGLLLTGKYGPMVRLGAVTTDFQAELCSGSGSPLKPAPAEYCFSCDICAHRCPGGAIPFREADRKGEMQQKSKNNIFGQGGETGPVGLGIPWKTDHAACFAMWQKFGTDCGICVSVCPYK